METTNNIIITISWITKDTIEIFAKDYGRDGQIDVLDRYAAQDGGIKTFANFIASPKNRQIYVEGIHKIEEQQAQLIQSSQDLISVNIE